MQGYDNWKLAYPPDWDYDEELEAIKEANEDLDLHLMRDDIEVNE